MHWHHSKGFWEHGLHSEVGSSTVTGAHHLADASLEVQLAGLPRTLRPRDYCSRISGHVPSWKLDYEFIIYDSCKTIPPRHSSNGWWCSSQCSSTKIGWWWSIATLRPSGNMARQMVMTRQRRPDIRVANIPNLANTKTSTLSPTLRPQPPPRPGLPRLRIDLPVLIYPFLPLLYTIYSMRYQWLLRMKFLIDIMSLLPVRYCPLCLIKMLILSRRSFSS